MSLEPGCSVPVLGAGVQQHPGLWGGVTPSLLPPGVRDPAAHSQHHSHSPGCGGHRAGPPDLPHSGTSPAPPLQPPEASYAP